MNTSQPRQEEIRNEREFAGALIALGMPESLTIPSDCFADIASKEAIKAAERTLAKGELALPETVLDDLKNNSESLACDPGKIADVVTLGEQPGIEDLKNDVVSAYNDRLKIASLHNAIKSVGNGAKVGAVFAEIQNHHDCSFGSIGSYDPETSNIPTPFPVKSLGSFPSKFCSEVERSALVPDSLAAASVLGIISASIGSALKIKNYKGETGANLFIMGIAESGTGKDSALNLVSAPLDEIDDLIAEKWETQEKPEFISELRLVNSSLKKIEKANSGTIEVEAQVRDDAKALEQRRIAIEKELERDPALVVGDITKEALAIALSSKKDETVASICPEARGILNVVQGRYSKGSSDEDIYTAGYSGGRIKVNRVGRPAITIHSPTLSVTWMVQPDAFQKFIGDVRMTDSGLLPRFLPFDSKAEPLEIPENHQAFDDALKEEWRDFIGRLVALRQGEAQTVLPSPEASTRLRDFDNQLRRRRSTGGDLKDVASYAARWAEIAWRVALVLHASIHLERSAAEELSEETAVEAIKIVEWFSGEALALLSAAREARARGRTDRLRELLAGAENQKMPIRELSKSHGFEHSELESIGKRVSWLSFGEVQNPKGGRRSKVAIYSSEIGQKQNSQNSRNSL